MSGLFSAMFLCGGCGRKFNEIIPRGDRGKAYPCPTCGSDAQETIGAPLVAKASLPDGTKQHDLRRLAEASRLEAESFDVEPSKRGDYDKAIKELTKSGSKS